jgi:fucose permease
MADEAAALPSDDWRRIFPLALGGLLVLGVGDSMLGVAWPSVRTGFGQPLAALGEVGVAVTLGYLTASPLSGWLAGRVGTGWLLVLAAGVGTVALAGYAFVPAWPLFVLSGAAYGLWAGLIDPGINSWMALVGNLRAMNLVHFAYGVGATVGPLLATLVLTLGWGGRTAFAGAAVATAAMLVSFAVTRKGWGRPVRGDAGGGRARARVPWLLLAGILLTFFVYVGIEIGTGTWTFSHLVGLGTPQPVAGLIVSAYWGALTVGRLALAAIGSRIHVSRVAAVSCLVALAGGVAYVVVPAGVGALAGVGLLGVGFAGIFPALMSLVPVRVGADRTPHVVGAILAASAVGGSLIPAGMGLAMQAAGVGVLPWLLLAGAIVLLVVNSATDHLAASQPSS